MPSSSEPHEATDRLFVVGQGYVGLPLALAFDDAGYEVIGYDIDPDRAAALREGVDPTGSRGDAAVAASDATFTADPGGLADADYVIVTVPTPVGDGGTPDLSAVRSAGRLIGDRVTPGTTVVLESTVYPGATREVLRPAVEAAGGATAGEEFRLGYSPERLSPGDAGRTLDQVVKVVGGATPAVTEELATLYESIVDAGVHRAPSIEAAEAAKCVENVQRDLNIALANELSELLGRLGVDTDAVLDAAATKWNFHDYRPGLVGGHCIPVDPHYLIHKAEREGFDPRLVRTAREINESVAERVVDMTVSALRRRAVTVPAGAGGDAGVGVGSGSAIENGSGSGATAEGSSLDGARTLVLGLAYKPGANDPRSAAIERVVDGLQRRGLDVVAHDPHVDADELRELHGVPVQGSLSLSGFDALVVPTAHEEFAALDTDLLAEAMNGRPAVVDVQGGLPDAADDGRFVYRTL